MASEITDRLAPLRDVARRLSVDAIALVPGANFTRLFARSFHTSERPLLVVVPVEGAPAAIVPNLELDAFAAIGFEGEVHDWRDQNGYTGAFEALFAALPVGSIAVEGRGMRVFVDQAIRRAVPGVRIVDAEAEIASLRLRKSAQEIAALEEAVRITERALGEVFDEARPGRTETELQSLLRERLFRAGAEDFSFGPIVAAGGNSALPHATARADYRIADGDALLIDCGARFGGLAADITRTVFVGSVSDEQREVYATVLAANRAGLDAVRPGATAHDVDEAATAVLEGSPFADRIRHKTGHGLGREVHEAPWIMRGNDQVLEPGTVFTIEPGLYRLDAFGVRIEDDVLVTEDGARSLTGFERSLTIL